MKTSLFSAVLFSAFTLATPAMQAQTGSEENAIRTWLDAGFQAYLSGDMEKMLAYYNDDAVVIDWMGRRSDGKDALREAFKAEQEAPSTDVRAHILDIRFLEPGIAVVCTELKGKSEMNGQPFEWTGNSTMLLSKKSGDWRIVLEQNTGVAPQ